MKFSAFPSLALLASLALATPAMALDNLNSFKLEGGSIRPNTMTCTEFMKASPDMQMFVSAWYDGNSSTFNPIPRAKYMEEDVISMYDALVKGCKAEPSETLEALKFDYGGKGESSKPTCALLSKMPDAKKASLLLVWTLGYLEDSNDGSPKVDVKGFADFGNDIFKRCQGKPTANLLELVMANQGIKPEDADDDDAPARGNARPSSPSRPSSPRPSADEKDLDN